MPAAGIEIARITADPMAKLVKSCPSPPTAMLAPVTSRNAAQKPRIKRAMYVLVSALGEFMY